MLGEVLSGFDLNGANVSVLLNQEIQFSLLVAAEVIEIKPMGL